MRKLTCGDWAFIGLILVLVFIGFTVVAYSGIDLAKVTVQPGESIQATIDRAVNGDIVWVAPGTYTENIDFKGKAITVKGISGPKYTVIDGGCPEVNPDPNKPTYGSTVRFISGEGTDSILEGFTITNGVGTYWVYGQDQCKGAGIFGWGSGATIRNCHITGNKTHYHASHQYVYTDVCGGGIYFSRHYYDAPKDWWDNVAPYFDLVIEDCVIEDNWSGELYPGVGASGVRDLTFRDNTITGNGLWGPLHVNESRGFGFYVNTNGEDLSHDSQITISGNKIYGNHAPEYAGKYWCYVARVDSWDCFCNSINIDIYNNVIADNERNCGLFVTGTHQVNIHHNTIHHQWETGGLGQEGLTVGNLDSDNWAELRVHNNVIWVENSPDYIHGIIDIHGWADAWVSHNCWNYKEDSGWHNIQWWNLEGDWNMDWENVVNTEPLLVAPGWPTYDYHLQLDSPCVGMGVGCQIDVDFEDHGRHVEYPDMGADELVSKQ